MLNEHKTELIQAGIDGELNDAEREEFMQLLRDSEAARQFHEEMQRVSKLLSEVPAVEPPADLNGRIMDSISLPVSRGMPEWLRNWFQPASYGLAVAAGMLMAVGIIRLAPDSNSDIPDLVGSMVGYDSLAVTQTASRIQIDLDSVQGTVKHKSLQQSQAVQFQLQSRQPVETELVIAGSGLKFGGFAGNGGTQAEFRVSGGNVQVLDQGKQQFVVFLQNSTDQVSAPTALEVIIRQGGVVVFQGSINVEG